MANVLEDVAWRVVVVLYVGVRVTVSASISVLETVDWALHKYGMKL